MKKTPLDKMIHWRQALALACLCLTFSCLAMPPETPDKARVIVLTDIENEPDDAQSLVRFLVYSNHWDIEGLIASTSVHQPHKLASWRIREIVQAYGKVRENLLAHEPGFPETESLLSVISEGRPAVGMKAVGKSMDSAGSELIIEALEKDDSRPVWILSWGGPNCLAQALWKIKNTRSPKELKKLVGKLRVYAISDQDNSGPWIRKIFPQLFYIVSPGFYAGGAYHYATWTGISGDNFHGRFSGADFDIVANPWLDKNIRAKGPLGAEYPSTKYLMEGDSPSFLFLINNGLSKPQHPDYGSWGGRYELYRPKTQKWFYEPETRDIWSNAEDEVKGHKGNWHTSNKASIWRWRTAYQNDFAARMDWTIKPYAGVNHPPIAQLKHANKLSAKSGEKILLSAAGSSDPDGDSLHYHWSHYREPGTYASVESVKIKNADKKSASFIAPKVEKAETLHVILRLSDNGKPSLTRYQRVIVSLRP